MLLHTQWGRPSLKIWNHTKALAYNRTVGPTGCYKRLRDTRVTMPLNNTVLVPMLLSLSSFLPIFTVLPELLYERCFISIIITVTLWDKWIYFWEFYAWWKNVFKVVCNEGEIVVCNKGEIMILMANDDELLCLWFHYDVKCSLFFQVCQWLLLNSNTMSAWRYGWRAYLVWRSVYS